MLQRIFFQNTRIPRINRPKPPKKYPDGGELDVEGAAGHPRSERVLLKDAGEVASPSPPCAPVVVIERVRRGLGAERAHPPADERSGCLEQSPRPVSFDPDVVDAAPVRPRHPGPDALDATRRATVHICLQRVDLIAGAPGSVAAPTESLAFWFFATVLALSGRHTRTSACGVSNALTEIKSTMISSFRCAKRCLRQTRPSRWSSQLGQTLLPTRGHAS